MKKILQMLHKFFIFFLYTERNFNKYLTKNKMNTVTTKNEGIEIKDFNIHETYEKNLNLEDKEQRNREGVKNKNVAIVGLGYVGLPLALLAKENGYSVIGIDTDEEKVELIRRQISPFVDEKIGYSLKKNKLFVNSNPIFLRESEIIIVCVPTPIDENSKPDFVPLIEASKSVAKELKPGDLVIIESTVNPGVCESIVLPILEKSSGLKAGIDFDLSHCPERINPGDSTWTLENINRVVGSLNERGLRKTLVFYRSILGKGKVTPMASIKEAEAVKIVENSFRDINIAFVNELAMSFEVLGIDIVNVIRGASTKPFSFLAHYPGCGVGGHCIPVDPYYLIEHAKKNGFEHKFLMQAREINNYMPSYTIKLLKRELKKRGIEKGKVVVLGASYKPDISDVRESPSFEIYKELRQNGFDVDMYDPYVKKEIVSNNLDESLTGAVAIIIATAHREFLTLNPKFLSEYGIQVVIDGRNCLNKKIFEDSQVSYKGIGR